MDGENATEVDDEGPGPLTQGLRHFRAAASGSPPLSPCTPSPSSLPSSPVLLTQPGDAEGSFLFCGAVDVDGDVPFANEEVVVVVVVSPGVKLHVENLTSNELSKNR